jgi:hypothetical protein
MCSFYRFEKEFKSKKLNHTLFQDVNHFGKRLEKRDKHH